MDELVEHDGVDDAAEGGAGGDYAEGEGATSFEVVGDDAEGRDIDEADTDTHSEALGQEEL